MTQTNIASGAGLRHIRIYALNSSGAPSGDQSGADGYDGVRIEGAKSFTSNVPDARTVVHTGDDNPFAMDVLPPSELETATLTTGKTNLSLDALLSNTKVEDLNGDLVMGGMSTDKQGSEISVMIMAFRQALDTEKGSATFGHRRYITRMYPSGRVVPKAGSMEDGGDDVNTYNIIPTKVTKAPWQKAFTELTNGFTEGQALRLISSNPLFYEVFDGNATMITFNLQHTPISAAKTHVFVGGVAATVASVDTTAETFTAQSAPAYGTANVHVLYETSETLS